MNPFKQSWFWLLILSIIGFIAFMIIYETMGATAAGNTTTPFWIWIIFIISVALFVAALIFYIVSVNMYKRQLEIAAACGELPQPKVKKPIECPKQKCVEKKIVECVDITKCNNSSNSKTLPADQSPPSNLPSLSPSSSPILATQSSSQLQIPKITPTLGIDTYDEPLSMSGLKPLNTLAPPYANPISI